VRRRFGRTLLRRRRFGVAVHDGLDRHGPGRDQLLERGTDPAGVPLRGRSGRGRLLRSLVRLGRQVGVVDRRRADPVTALPLGPEELADALA
jgi:hypothetical protein